MKKQRLFISVLLCLILSLAGCSDTAEYRDGVYTKTSGTEKNGGCVEVTIRVSEGKIAECSMKMFDRNGAEKGNEYGRGASDQVYRLAQAAINEAKKYPSMVVEAGGIDEVDAISGATETYEVFREVVTQILQEAQNP